MMKKVADVMSHPVVSTTPGASVIEAERLATWRGIHRLLVVNGPDENVVGVVCMCDLADADRGATVERCMSSPVPTVSSSASLEEAARIMRKRAIGCLPVVVGGIVVGIVTRGDLRRAGVPGEEIGAPRAQCELGSGD